MEQKFTRFDARIKVLEARGKTEDNCEYLKMDRAKVDKTCELKDMPAIEKLNADASECLNRVLDKRLSIVLQEQRKCLELGGKGSSPSKKLTARLDHVAGYFLFRNEILNTAICQVQLFNIDKQFGFFNQDCQPFQYRAATWTGKKVEQGSMTLRNVFRATFTDEHTVKEKQRKKPDLEKALKYLISNTTFAIKELQAMNKEVPNEDAQAPVLPQELTFGPTIVLSIRQSVECLASMYQDITALHKELPELRDTVMCAMTIWVSSGSPAWQYARAHVHEFPEVRKYVWTRNHLLSNKETSRWQHMKILRHYGQSIEEFQAEWEEEMENVRQAFPSLDELLVSNDGLSEKLEQDIKDAVLTMPPPTNLPIHSTRP